MIGCGNNQTRLDLPLKGQRQPKDRWLFPASHLFPRLPRRVLLVVCPGGHSILFLPPSSPLYVSSSLKGAGFRIFALCSYLPSFTIHPVFSVAKMLGYSKSATVAFLLTFLLFLGHANAAPAIPEKRTHSALRVARDGENLSQSTTVQVTQTLQT